MQTLLAILCYMADVAILSTYFLTARNPKNVRWFNWANAIGCIPLILLEVGVGLWQPVILTGFFGIIGWYGLIYDRKRDTL